MKPTVRKEKRVEGKRWPLSKSCQSTTLLCSLVAPGKGKQRETPALLSGSLGPLRQGKRGKKEEKPGALPCSPPQDAGKKRKEKGIGAKAHVSSLNTRASQYLPGLVASSCKKGKEKAATTAFLPLSVLVEGEKKKGELWARRIRLLRPLPRCPQVIRVVFSQRKKREKGAPPALSYASPTERLIIGGMALRKGERRKKSFTAHEPWLFRPLLQCTVCRPAAADSDHKRRRETQPGPPPLRLSTCPTLQSPPPQGKKRKGKRGGGKKLIAPGKPRHASLIPRGSKEKEDKKGPGGRFLYHLLRVSGKGRDGYEKVHIATTL